MTHDISCTALFHSASLTLNLQLLCVEGFGLESMKQGLCVKEGIGGESPCLTENKLVCCWKWHDMIAESMLAG